MKKKILFLLYLIFIIGCLSQSDSNSEKDIFFEKIVSLDISRNGYTLGKKLTDSQKQKAQKTIIKNPFPGTFKFKDHDQFIVADKKTDRIMIIYEHYKQASKEKVRDLIGSFFMEYGTPTIIAHSKSIYWIYDKNGIVSEVEYQKIKESGKKLDALSTIKIIASESIAASRNYKPGMFYYVISSEPMLNLVATFD